MDNRLQRYLSEHHASAGGALDLVNDLLKRVGEGEDQQFLLDLKRKVETDQENLMTLMNAAGLDQSLLLEMTAALGAQVSRLKLAWEGLDPGKLGFMEAYEMLAVAMQSKRMLWLAMDAISGWFPEWRNVDFQQLETEAAAQRDVLEARTVRAAATSLVDEERAHPLQETVSV